MDSVLILVAVAPIGVLVGLAVYRILRQGVNREEERRFFSVRWALLITEASAGLGATAAVISLVGDTEALEIGVGLLFGLLVAAASAFRQPESDGRLLRIGLLVATVTSVFTIAVLMNSSNSTSADSVVEFDFLGVSNQDKPVYEITPELFYGGDQQFVAGANIVVKVGNTAVERTLNVAAITWDNRAVDLPLIEDSRVELSLSQLRDFSGVSIELVRLTSLESHEAMSGQFQLRLKHIDGQTSSPMITVKVAPWVHFTYLPRNWRRFPVDDQLTAIMEITNFGETGEFYARGALYEIPATDGTATPNSNGEWSPDLSWLPIAKTLEDNRDVVVVNEGGRTTIPLTFEQVELKPGRLYVVETWAQKNLPSVNYPNGNWREDRDAWRGRDLPSFSLLVVLPQ